MTEPQIEGTDEALMEAYAGGNSAAFECLFQRYGRPVFTFILHQVGSRAIAEDLLQDVFLGLVRSRDRYTRVGAFRSWLYTIARNALVDHRRKGALRETAGANEPMSDSQYGADFKGTWEQILPSTDPSSDPVSSSSALELRGRIERALLDLPAEQREVFLLRERAGLDFKAIAQVTESALGTVKSRMRYALAGLRQRLSEELASIPETFHG